MEGKNVVVTEAEPLVLTGGKNYSYNTITLMPGGTIRVQAAAGGAGRTAIQVREIIKIEEE